MFHIVDMLRRLSEIKVCENCQFMRRDGGGSSSNINRYMKNLKILTIKFIMFEVSSYSTSERDSM